jgi:hypothetical protein
VGQELLSCPLSQDAEPEAALDFFKVFSFFKDGHWYPIFSFFLFFETSSHYVARLALNSSSPLFCFQSAEITGMHHAPGSKFYYAYILFIFPSPHPWCWEWN